MSLSKRDEEDVRWFFQSGESSIGVSSNFGAMVAMLQTGIPCGSRTGDAAESVRIEQVKSVDRYRRIASIMVKLPMRYAVALERHYGMEPEAKRSRETELVLAVARDRYAWARRAVDNATRAYRGACAS